ncbi:MAG: dephospho-CoA kinase [Bacteroidales bacterium]|nr:dephospho-CoA kinase [Bacteroidales bacterium]
MKKTVVLCTGGIGSGKSYVIKVFNCLGIPSYDSDANAKQLYDTDQLLLQQVAEIAGEDVVVNGVLQRQLFASRIFSDPDKLNRVEDAVHPAVVRHFNKWKEEQESDIVIIESAILLESPELVSLPDYVIAVSAPLKIRIDRVMKRDGLTMDQVLERLDNQWSDEERSRYADFVIKTNDRDAIIPEAIKILFQIRNGKR